MKKYIEADYRLTQERSTSELSVPIIIKISYSLLFNYYYFVSVISYCHQLKFYSTTTDHPVIFYELLDAPRGFTSEKMKNVDDKK